MPWDLNDTVAVHARCIHETEKAILVNVSGTEFWIPKKAIAESSEVQGGEDEGELELSRRFAEKEGIE